MILGPDSKRCMGFAKQIAPETRPRGGLVKSHGVLRRSKEKVEDENPTAPEAEGERNKIEAAAE